MAVSWRFHGGFSRFKPFQPFQTVSTVSQPFQPFQLLITVSAAFQPFQPLIIVSAVSAVNNSFRRFTTVSQPFHNRFNRFGRFKTVSIGMCSSDFGTLACESEISQAVAALGRNCVGTVYGN